MSYSLCPLKPDPEPSKIISADPIASARLPSNACTGARCAFWLAQLDLNTGKPISGNCSVPVIGAMLAQIANTLAGFTVTARKIGEVPTPPGAKPS